MKEISTITLNVVLTEGRSDNFHKVHSKAQTSKANSQKVIQCSHSDNKNSLDFKLIEN